MPSHLHDTPMLPGLEPPVRLRVAFLGSGSSGNATAVWDDETLVLVDCGFSARETKRRLEAVGLGGRAISAILLTHEHSDHVGGLRVLAKRGGMPVYATRGTWSGLRLADDERPDDQRLVRCGDELALGELRVRVFAGMHDAGEPVGFTFEANGARIGMCTDSGRLTAEAAEVLSGCDLLGIESNHDPDMLEYGPYPYFLKRRIASERGHLSNRQACDALERLACDKLRTVVGLHLSRTNNAPDLAKRALVARCAGIGLPARTHVASQHEPLVCEIAGTDED